MDTNELYQTETALQHSKAPYVYQKGKVVGGKKWEGIDDCIHITLYKKPRRTPNQHCIINYMGVNEWVSEVAQSCPTLCDPVDCSPPGSSIHGILQARILEWVAISFSNYMGREPKKGHVHIYA